LTEKNDFSNIIYELCIDPRKDRLDFPCVWLDPEKKCRWIGEKKCYFIKLDWFYSNNMDDIKGVEL
jgi:hypothetical protein